jgi:hypothetical protein
MSTDSQSYDVYLCDYENVYVYNYPYMISEYHRDKRRNF